MDPDIIDLGDLFLLSRVPGIGPTRLRTLVTHFGTPTAVARASARDLLAVGGIDRKTAVSVVRFFRSTEPATLRRFVDDQASRLKRIGGRAITYWHSEYPPLLKKIYDPPPFLFLRGTLSEDDADAIAIVGTRSPSSYGSHLADRFATELADRGLTVVSGLARGVDTIAHAATVKAGGRTLAVIGSGIDVPYPPENRSLSDRIADQGAVLSEFLMGTKPDAMNFPQRNRIISGLTLGTVVIETGTEGGALITARSALEQNREVFAIPSPVNDAVRSGTNRLIKEGQALLVESVDDIIAEIGPRLRRSPGTPSSPGKQQACDLTIFEQKILDAVDDTPVHIDAISQRAACAVSEVSVLLLSLEFKGTVRQLPGKMFQRIC